MGKRCAVFVAFLLILPMCGLAEDITMVKHAKRLESLETHRYTVQKGDTLWKIFLRNFKANKEDMPYLYKKFRELNPRVKDLNHIRSGQKITIPRLPAQGKTLSVKAASEDIYVIRKGQHLAKVLREVYGLPDDLIFNEYLNLIKEMNPEIEDLDHVEPGQTVRMPKTDEIVRAVEKLEEKPDEVMEIKPAEPVKPMMAQITEISEAPEKEPPEPVTEEPEPVEEFEIEEPSVEPKKAVIEEVKDAELEDAAEKAVAEKEEPAAEVTLQETEPVEEIGIEEPPIEEGRPQETEKNAAPLAASVVTKAAEKPAKTETSDPGTGPGYMDAEKRELATRLVRNTLMPALTSMGGQSRDQGTYFMPMSGGGSFSIDTSEIPVMELDTGRRIILDVNNRISSEVKELLEKTFPSCSIISGPPADTEGLMDRILSVSGYFSINKDASPLLVGEDEKVRFSGKWIVYKDYTRHNVFVVNLLSDKEEKTPKMIRNYASRFGIDLIELGGTDSDRAYDEPADISNLEHSYQRLFDEVGIAYETDKVLDLVSLDSVKITYRAPIILGSTILTGELPEETMLDLLRGRNYTVIHTSKASLEEVLGALEIGIDGPPVRVVVAERRTELELPALKVNDAIILKRSIDRDIGAYLASQGKKVLMW